MQAGPKDKSLAYWKEELSELPDLEMVLDKERAPVLTNSRNTINFSVPVETIARLKDVCIANGYSLRTGMIAAFASCVCRHTTQTDVCVGHKISDKNSAGNYEVAILLEYNGNTNSFIDYLKVVEDKVTKAYAHGNVTFQDLVRTLNLQPNSRRNLIFQTMLNYYESPLKIPEPAAIDNICEIVVEVQDSEDGGLAGKLHYLTDLYELPTMQRFVNHFNVLLHEISSKPSAPLDAVPLLPAEELQEYATWNSTETDFGPFTRVDRMFEQVVTKFPNNEALRLDGRALTFAEVNSAADEIASKLFVRGVENGERVGLVLDRSFDMYICMIAIAKVGGVIVPIDIAHTPMDRIEYMFSDSSVRIVIVHDVHEEKLVDIAGQFTLLSWSRLSAETTEEMYHRDPSVDYDTEAVFGIFYTSGTTGRPKGVMNMHRNVFNLVKAFSKYFSIKPTDRIIQFASYSFIQSLRQIWPTLCSGACLVIVRNPLLFGDVINSEKVTKMVITASALGMLDPTRHPSLRAIQLGGEAVPLKLAQAWNKQVKFMVGLGPTELTAHACCNPNIVDKMNIGSPHDNVRCYITNGQMQLQPWGCVGELCIAGANVAKGYLNMEQATREKFIQNPFVAVKETLYKTGDLALRNRNGDLEFIGRRDDQVKIHGYRIELAEIQRAIEQGDGVEKAAVLVKNDQIVAYVSPVSVKEPDLRSYLSGRLPKYMVPTHIVVLERFPLNKNGKLDRAALPDPMTVAAKVPEGQRRAAKSTNESIVTAAFRTVLNLPTHQQVFVTDNFFDLGGSSLTVALLARHLTERTGVEVSLMNVFDLKTVEAMAVFLDSQSGASQKEEVYWKDSKGAKIKDSKEGELAEQGKPIHWVLYSLMQAFVLPIVVCIQVLPAIGVILAFRQLLFMPPHMPLYISMFLLPLALYLSSIANIALVVVFKWLLVGRLRAGIYPMHSYMFFKWWLNRKLVWSLAFFLWIFTETPVYPWVLRLLGASVGSQCFMDMVDIEEPDLVTIGSQFIGHFEAAVCTSEIVENKLVLRNVTLGNEVYLGKRAIVLPGSDVPNYVEIAGGSGVDSNSVLASGAVYAGYPGKEIAKRDATNAMRLPSFTHTALYNVLQLLNVYVLLFVFQWPFVLLAQIAYAINSYDFIFVPGFIAVLGSLVVIVSYMAVVIVGKYALIGNVRADTVYRGAFFMLRRWVVDRLILNPIFTYLQPTFFSYCSIGPAFWRLLGASIGKDTWMAPPMLDAGLNLVRFGDSPHMGQHNVFFTAVLSHEGVQFKAITIGSHVTFGQRSIMSAGVSIGDQCTIGALTFLPQDFALADKKTACGSPPIVFETTLDTKGFTAQLQRMARNEVRKSVVASVERGSMAAAPFAMRASQLGRTSSAQRTSSNPRPSAFRASAAVSGSSQAHKVDYRPSLFSDKPPLESPLLSPVLSPAASADGSRRDEKEDKEAEVTALSRCMFTTGVVLVKVGLPAVVALCYAGLLYLWRNRVLDVSDPVWLAVLLPLTYVTGTLVVTVVLAFLASLGLFNFRSGLMDYFSVGFFHWYIFTDILYGYVQMIMSNLGGTGLYVYWMRLMGAELGEGCYVDIPGGLREVNNIIMQSNSVLLTRFIYAHYIDHGKLQFAPVVIGSRVCINKENMIMPLTTYEDNVTLRPYSSTIKGQVFGANRVFQGHPAAKAFTVPAASSNTLLDGEVHTPMIRKTLG